jgi:hypothetical protein
MNDWQKIVVDSPFAFIGIILAIGTIGFTLAFLLGLI